MSLKRRLLISLLSWIILAPATLHAQFIGFSSPQTVVATPISNANCAGGVISTPSAVANLGQSFHYLHYQVINAGGRLPVEVRISLQASYDGTQFFLISDSATNLTTNGTGELVGFGQFPIYQVTVSCLGGTGTNTVTVNYSGTSVSSSLQFSDLDRTIFQKIVFLQGATGSNRTGSALRTPYGTSSGVIGCQYLTAGVANSTISISANTDAALGSAPIATFTLANQATGPQFFTVPIVPTSELVVTYTSGGASANTFNCEYLFFKPGVSPQATQYTHQTGTTATIAKATPGLLHNVTINTGGAGTLSVFDLAAAACTGTPATNVVAVITSVATTTQTFTYDVNMLNGICLKASAAMDFTVSSQ